MMQVFIGGSRRLSKLNSLVKGLIDELIQKDITVLIGDANGADKTVQNYLLNKRYTNVIVYCIHNECRNNLGNWHICSINPPVKNASFRYYSAKDLEMVKETDYGLMLWDSKSKGTLNNIVNLLKEGKLVWVYFNPNRTLHALKTYRDLGDLLKNCDQNSLAKLDKDLRFSQLIIQPTLWSTDIEFDKHDI